MTLVSCLMLSHGELMRRVRMCRMGGLSHQGYTMKHAIALFVLIVIVAVLFQTTGGFFFLVIILVVLTLWTQYVMPLMGFQSRLW